MSVMRRSLLTLPAAFLGGTLGSDALPFSR